MTQSKWITDRHHKISNSQRIRVAQIDRCQALCWYLDDCDVGFGIGTHHLRLKRTAVIQTNTNLVRVFDHMMIGYYVAEFTVDDDTRSLTLSRTLSRLTIRTRIEKVLEKWVRLERTATS